MPHPCWMKLREEIHFLETGFFWGQGCTLLGSWSETPAKNYSYRIGLVLKTSSRSIDFNKSCSTFGHTDRHTHTHPFADREIFYAHLIPFTSLSLFVKFNVIYKLQITKLFLILNQHWNQCIIYKIKVGYYTSQIFIFTVHLSELTRSETDN